MWRVATAFTYWIFKILLNLCCCFDAVAWFDDVAWYHDIIFWVWTFLPAYVTVHVHLSVICTHVDSQHTNYASKIHMQLHPHDSTSKFSKCRAASLWLAPHVLPISIEKAPWCWAQAAASTCARQRQVAQEALQLGDRPKELPSVACLMWCQAMG